MGCSGSKPDSPAAMRELRENRAIETAQRKAATALAAKIELIILGTGDSGKTTLRKQLSNVHNQCFENEEYRRAYCATIIANLIDGVLEIFQEMASFHQGGAHAEQEVMREAAFIKLTEISKQNSLFINDELATLLERFIHDPEFEGWASGHACNNQRAQVQDCWYVFADELKAYPDWGGLGWIPSTDDCIRSRVRTSGVIQEDLVIDGLNFIIYDVGGQRAERRKWMHMFDSVLSCIYVAALSEYDQVLFEDRSKNRLEEALELFSETMNSPWLTQATTLLFLNKRDLFHKKFSEEKIPLNISGRFPNAPVGNDDEEGAIRWIANEFTSRKRQLGSLGKVFVHVTTATDPSNIKAVFRMARETILGRTMLAVGLTE